MKDDFSLMHKIVMKLPISEQTKYTNYITSAVLELDPSSRWDKFWAWLKQRHKAAVQSGLMFMCTSLPNSKSGMTCNSCGRLGHFARSCPSKKPGGNTVAKVNIAVSKIATRADYDKHLAETKNKSLNVPHASRAHTHTLVIFPLEKLSGPRIGWIRARSSLA